MNLFICRTIFQVYYAGILIKNKNIKDVMLAYLSEGLSDREKNVLSCCGINRIVVIEGSNPYKRLLKQIWFLNYLKRITKKQSVSLYFSSIDDPFIQAIISKISLEMYIRLMMEPLIIYKIQFSMSRQKEIYL